MREEEVEGHPEEGEEMQSRASVRAHKDRDAAHRSDDGLDHEHERDIGGFVRQQRRNEKASSDTCRTKFTQRHSPGAAASALHAPIGLAIDPMALAMVRWFAAHIHEAVVNIRLSNHGGLGARKAYLGSNSRQGVARRLG